MGEDFIIILFATFKNINYFFAFFISMVLINIYDEGVTKFKNLVNVTYEFTIISKDFFIEIDLTDLIKLLGT